MRFGTICLHLLAAALIGYIVGCDVPRRDTGACSLVELRELLEERQSYDGKCVQVSGTLVLGFEEQKLYADLSSFERHALRNSLPVDVPRWWDSGPMGPQYPARTQVVEIVATFEAFPETGIHAGQLVRVQCISGKCRP